MDVFDSTSPAAFARAGLIVPRHKQTAVARNRLKRRLREIVRREVLPDLDAAALRVDLLVRVRPEAYRADFDTLRAELRGWTERRCSHGPSSG